MEQLRGHVELILLAVIGSGPSHGYAIIDRARLRSEGVFDLGDGAVYPVLHKLERLKLVRSTWTEVDGRQRRVYALTRAGQTELARLSASWTRVARGMQALLGHQ